MEETIITAGSGLTDTEAEEDLLEISEYVKACAGFIMNCRTPMSIAIQGGWGTGKSSFMHLVEKELEDLKSPQMEAVSVRFNTWQYSRSGEERLFIPLVRCLEKKLDEVNKDNKEYTDYFKDRKIIFSGRWFGKTAGKVAEAVPGKTGAALALFGQMMEGCRRTGQCDD